MLTLHTIFQSTQQKKKILDLHSLNKIHSENFSQFKKLLHSIVLILIGQHFKKQRLFFKELLLTSNIQAPIERKGKSIRIALIY